MLKIIFSDLLKLLKKLFKFIFSFESLVALLLATIMFVFMGLMMGFLWLIKVDIWGEYVIPIVVMGYILYEFIYKKIKKYIKSVKERI